MSTQFRGHYKAPPYHAAVQYTNPYADMGFYGYPELEDEAEEELGTTELAQAVQQNRRYSQSLGWHAYFNQLARLPGFTTYSPNEQAFAQAVARWQRAQRVLTVDGVVGPTTWSQMRLAMGLETKIASGYPRVSRFVPAKYFTRSTKPRRIRRIVIYITAGHPNINGTIRWFRDMLGRNGQPAINKKGKLVKASAHYIVGQDGEVVQMVRDNDIAYHASSANADSIGIEHVARPKGAFGRNDRGLFPTQEQYCSSAALVRWLSDTYNIPKDRVHILGHAEADPQTTHRGCPNAVWDWDRFMKMVISQTTC